MQIGRISQEKSEPKRDQEKLLALSQGAEQWDGPWAPCRGIVTELQLLPSPPALGGYSSSVFYFVQLLDPSSLEEHLSRCLPSTDEWMSVAQTGKAGQGSQEATSSKEEQGSPKSKEQIIQIIPHHHHRYIPLWPA